MRTVSFASYFHCGIGHRCEDGVLVGRKRADDLTDECGAQCTVVRGVVGNDQSDMIYAGFLPINWTTDATPVWNFPSQTSRLVSCSSSGSRFGNSRSIFETVISMSRSFGPPVFRAVGLRSKLRVRILRLAICIFQLMDRDGSEWNLEDEPKWK